MISEMSFPKHFWEDAINTAFHVINKTVVHPIIDNTPYQLLKGRKPNDSYFHIFGCKCFILNKKRTILVSLMLSIMKEYSYGTHFRLKIIEFTIIEHRRLKNKSTLHLMNPHPKRHGKVSVLIFHV